MKFPLVSFALFLVAGSALGKDNNVDDDLTYDDLLKTKVSCASFESCKEEFADQSQDRTCGCDSDCSQLGTCCIDSQHRNDNSARRAECRNVASSFSKMGYFLVSKCPPESTWKDLCEKGRKKTDKNDILKLAPVTSLYTSVSYKNYDCFRCYENGPKYRTWLLRVQSNAPDESKVIGDGLSVLYDTERQGWNAKTDDGYVLENIQWNFLPPEELSVPPKACHFVLVSDCAPYWTDKDARKKCGAYTAVVYSKRNDSVSFRNPHCALCNFETAGSIDCGFQVFQNKQRQFEFSDVINVDRASRCGSNARWDATNKKCRSLTCLLPGYVIKGNSCVPPD